MDTILFIDDEVFFAERYLTELRTNYAVRMCESVVEALEWDNNQEIRAIVLDIMMPPPAGLSAQATNHGADTGLWFLKEIREAILQRPLPVIILTNRIPGLIREEIRQMGFPESLVDVLHKTDTSPKQLLRRLQLMLNPPNTR